ncbi:MAG: YicC family protein [Planctomycetota bacterium]|nr:MAG: YicC family protein [Planctomycetota bacterium]
MNSMTGFGSARTESGGELITVDLSSVNNRYVKIISRIPEALYPFEREMEQEISKKISRGTVYVTITVQSPRLEGASRIDEDVAAAYIKQARSLARKHKLSVEISLDGVLSLPNVIRAEINSEEAKRRMWNKTRKVLDAALKELCAMRAREGAALKKELASRAGRLRRVLAKVRRRRPQMIKDYRKKFHERLNTLLKSSGVTMSREEVLREVAIFADRCDVAEEMCRLESHIEQFVAALDAREAPGKKLDFISQEMLREANTIGSKSNDAETTRLVVDMKTEIGKIKEQLQNVE